MLRDGAGSRWLPVVACVLIAAFPALGWAWWVSAVTSEVGPGLPYPRVTSPPPVHTHSRQWYDAPSTRQRQPQVAAPAADPPVGYVTAPEGVEYLQLSSARGPVTVRPSDGKVAVAPGRYWISPGTTMARQDKRGRTWEYRGRDRQRRGFEVRSGETHEIAFGPPLTLSVEASGGPTVALSFVITGSGGERCNGISVDGRRPPAPTFRIVSADGKAVHTGEFHFG